MFRKAISFVLQPRNGLSSLHTRSFSCCTANFDPVSVKGSFISSASSPSRTRTQSSPLCFQQKLIINSGIAEDSLGRRCFSASSVAFTAHTHVSEEEITVVSTGQQTGELELQGVSSKIRQQLEKGEQGRLFAVVHIGGVQRKITTEDIIVYNGHFPADIGDRIRLEKVLLVGGSDFTLVGKPLLSRGEVRVEATVIEKVLEQEKVRAFYRRRKRTRRMIPYQQPLAYLRINSIEISPLEEAGCLDAS